MSRNIYCKGALVKAVKFGDVWLCQGCGATFAWVVS
jgi:ribosomal protein L37AE/L43A